MGAAHAKAIGHPFSLALTLSLNAWTLAEAGDCDEALDFCRQCVDLCEVQNLPYWARWAMVFGGVVAARQGRYADAEVQLEQGLRDLSATGTQNAQGRTRAWRAIALAQLGRYAEARQQAEIGRERCRVTGEIVYLPWCSYARGITELLDAGAVPGAAEQWFHSAISEARSQGNRLIELRAANSLAHLWHAQGKTREALDLLAPIFNWFSEGFDTKDLKEAKSLLESLSAARDNAH